MSESTLPPAVLNTLSLATVQSQAVLIGWHKLHSTTVGSCAAGPTPSRLWSEVEQRRKRGSEACEYFWPRCVPSAVRAWMSTTVGVFKCVNLFHNTSLARRCVLQRAIAWLRSLWASVSHVWPQYWEAWLWQPLSRGWVVYETDTSKSLQRNWCCCYSKWLFILFKVDATQFCCFWIFQRSRQSEFWLLSKQFPPKLKLVMKQSWC